MENLMFAICDPCGAHAMCFDLGNDEHICESCHYAPAREAAWKKMHDNQVKLIELLNKLWFIVPNGYKSEITATISEIKS